MVNIIFSISLLGIVSAMIIYVLKKIDTKKSTIEDVPYTFEELKEAWNNPNPMTQEEIDNTFLSYEQTKNIDLSTLKI